MGQAEEKCNDVYEGDVWVEETPSTAWAKFCYTYTYANNLRPSETFAELYTDLQ